MTDATRLRPNGTSLLVSVLPDSGYYHRRGPVAPSDGDCDRLRTAQPDPHGPDHGIFVFHDNNPINNAPDLPEETPGTGDGQTDMSGFTVKLEDAGGRYGMSAGEAFHNAFGHPHRHHLHPGMRPHVGGDAHGRGQGFF